MSVYITRAFLFGLLLVIFSGFLMIYSVFKGYLYSLEYMEFSLLIVGFIIGMLGLFIPEEKMRDVWVSIGVAFGISTLLFVYLSVSPNVGPTIGTFPIIFIITFAVIYLVLKRRNRGKKSVSKQP